jgi:hypothetical protein
MIFTGFPDFIYQKSVFICVHLWFQKTRKIPELILLLKFAKSSRQYMMYNPA